MLDNERLIYKMLLEQKLGLVTSATLYKSSPVGAYEFPVVRFSEKPFWGKDVAVTQFPADGTLVSSWNTELVEKVFAYTGEEARSRDVFDGYYACNDPKVQGITSSHFLLSQYYAARNRGAAGKQPTAHEIAPASFGEELLRKNLTDTVLSEGAPDVVIAECVEDAELYLKNQEFHGLVYGVASSPEEAARYFFVGCAFVYLKENFFAELLSFFDLRIKNYRVAYGEYKEKKLSLKELDRRARILDIFDEGILDHACDRVINFLKKEKKAEVKVSENPTREEEASRRNEEAEHSRLARQAACESAVLLKNINGFLPLKRGMQVALIGEYLENFDFQRETFSCDPTKSRLPIDVARDYDELNVTGYAAGYRKGEGVNEELVANAARLASSSDCAVVFLSADPKKDDLPENQKLLVKALTGWHIKVVAVISADRCVDTRFAKDCHAVLYMGRGGQEAAAAAFDLLTGVCSPSGKLTDAMNGSVGYPFGYGLTYTTFEYRDLEIDESGVSVIVENKGDHDASAVVQLYLQKDGSIYSDKTLKGFGKEFIKKGDAVRVTIPFTENTFRYYDGDKKKYRTQGGVYNLYISESATADKLTGSVKIAADDGNTFTNTLSETFTDGTKAAFTEARGAEARKGMSFGMKLFLSLSLFVYYSAVMALLLFVDFIPVDRTDVFYACVGSALGVVDILIFAYIVVIGVKRKKPLLSAHETLSDMVDRVEEFVEVAKLTYPDPVQEMEKAKRAQEEEERRKTEEENAQNESEEEEIKADKNEVQDKKEEKKTEEKKAEASEKSEPSLDKPEDYPETDSFEKMFTSFRQFIMERGINIGAGSARRLLAAVAASRFVLITSKNQELLPDFMQAVCDYFGGLGVTEAEDKWNTIEDLLWRENAGRNMYSVFTNSVIDASRRRNKNAVAVIGNVDSKNLADWFAEIVDFASSPSEKHRIVLNEDTKFRIPQNFCSLLFAGENGLETELPREVLNASLIIDVSIRKADFVEENGLAKSAVSYPNFSALVREAREKYYLSEKNWLKIDSLFAFVNAGGRFRFGNKNTLMAEKFTSVLLACGAEESEALTSLLRFKIIPLIKTSRLYAQEDGISVLSDFLQKTFPDEELAKVQKVLSERPRKAEGKAGNTFYTPDYRGEVASETAEEMSEETVFEAVEPEPFAQEVADQEPIYAGASESDPQTYETSQQYDHYNDGAPAYAGSEPLYETPDQNASYGQNTYDQNTYDQSGYYDQSAYDQNTYGQNAYDQSAYDQNMYGQNAYDQNTYDQNAYGQYGSYGDDASNDRNNGGGEEQ